MAQSQPSSTPRLELVVDDNLSLAELAKMAVKASRAERVTAEAGAKQAEQERVKALLKRISTINADVAQAVHIVRSAENETDRKTAIATLQGPRDKLENEKDEILQDKGVQLHHIEELINELEKCDRWDVIENIVQLANDRGWFVDLPKNARGNTNYKALKFTNFKKQPELKKACGNLKFAVLKAVDKAAKKSKKLRAKQKSKQEGFVNRPRFATDQNH